MDKLKKLAERLGYTELFVYKGKKLLYPYRDPNYADFECAVTDQIGGIYYCTFDPLTNNDQFVEVLEWLIDQDLGAATKALAMYGLRVEGLRQAVLNAALAIGDE